MEFHKAMVVAVGMAELAHRNGHYEFTAVCARKIAEMYVAIVVSGEYWSLQEGLSMMPHDMDTVLWDALKSAQHIGNSGAHARAERMSIEDGDRALSAACIIAVAYLAKVRRARL